MCGGSETQLTKQIRIFPTQEQEEVLWRLSEKCRLLYNFALAERLEAWKNKERQITYIQQQNDLPKLKEKFTEYKWVYSRVLQYVLRTLDADYRSFIALRRSGHKKAQPPRFKGKKRFVTMVYNQSGFKIANGRIRFSHNCKDIDLEFIIPEEFSIRNTKVRQVALYARKKGYFV